MLDSINTFQFADEEPVSAVIKVVGVGGGGGNAVNHMVVKSIEGVEFICANTDAQALSKIESTIQLQLGGTITRGLGAGANPEVGREAATEDKERIAEALKGADMVFITAGMGGGTGTGAAPVVAQIAKEMGILTVAVITRPFFFEGKRRLKIAEAGMQELSKYVDSMITIENDKLLKVLGKDASLRNAFAAADDVLHDAVQGISDLITSDSLMNVDFADVRTVMTDMGLAMMGTGRATGENRAARAAEQAIANPLLEDVSLSGARGILVNITGGMDMGIGEFQEVGDLLTQYSSEDTTIVIGLAFDESLEDEIKVTVVATGIGRIDEPTKPQSKKTPAPTPAAKPEPVAQRSESVVVQPVVAAPIAEVQAPVQAKTADERASIARVPEKGLQEKAKVDKKWLDIPTFLRNQVD
jgi:cell division protein FtsZ